MISFSHRPRESALFAHLASVPKKIRATRKRWLIAIPAIPLAAGLVFAQAMQTVQTTDLVSVSSDGFAGDDISGLPAMSRDGRFVAFVSYATNLVPGNTSSGFDVFVHDYQAGVTQHVSVDSAGQPLSRGGYRPSISVDGRYVTFSGSSGMANHVLLHDRQTGTTETIDVDSTGAVGDHDADFSSVSADGRYVAFVSYATNLAPGDTNGQPDIFVRDRLNGTTERVSVSSAGEQANGFSGYVAISDNGRFVVFLSEATNLVPIDTNGVEDVFVRDLLDGTTTRVNVNNAGEQALHTPPGYTGPHATAAISSDGRFVAFESRAYNLDPADTSEGQDVFVRDLQTETTTLVSVDNDGVHTGGVRPYISGDGRHVAFASSSNVPPGVVVVRDHLSGTTELVSVDNSGGPIGTDGGGGRHTPISADGQFIAFGSNSSQLVPNSGDFPPVQIFVRNRGPQDGQTPSVSAGGPYIVHEGADVTLTATGFDPNGDVLTYAWDFDNDGTFETAGQSAVFSTATLAGPATYNIRVQITNAAGLAATASAVVASQNNAPTVDTGGSYNVNEGGSVTLTATGQDPDGDTLTYAWDLDYNGSFETPGQSVTFSAANIDGPAARGVRVQVTDPGGMTVTADTSVIINNVAPTADAGGPYVVNEDSPVTLTATATDPAPADTLTYAWDLDIDGTFETPGQSAVFSAAYLDGPRVLSLQVQVSDDNGGVTVASATLTIENVAPTVNAITAPVDPTPVGTAFNTSASITDPGTFDTHTAVWNWGDGSTSAGVVSGQWYLRDSTVTGSHGYATAGARTVGLTVTDDDGGQDAAAFGYAVTYDPANGAVTGGGTIASPAGAYPANPTVSGVAKLGFVSDVPKATAAPSGAVAFRLDDAGIEFRSSALAAMALSGARAEITGTGTLNGVSGYSFLVVTVDGEVSGGGGIDRFRIKIWDANGVVYDNEPGAENDADPTTALQSGSVIVQKTGV